MSKKVPSLVEESRPVFFTRDKAADIWGEVFSKDLEPIRAFYKKMREIALEAMRLNPKIFVGLSELLYRFAYQRFGKFIDESDFMADTTGVLPRAQVAFLQRQYTLAHAAPCCSTATVWDESHQSMVCMRSMDWRGAEDIANCTRIFDFINSRGEIEAKVAGIAGMIGVLTGVKKGFSISCNYAPWSCSARFKTDPTFLMRFLLQDEAVNDYAKAVEAVKSWRVGAPCFFVICGVERGEASVLEFGTRGRKFQRDSDANGVLVQTNHFLYEDFADNNAEFYPAEPECGWYDSLLLQNSQRRFELITERLAMEDLSAGVDFVSLFHEIYSRPPVMNAETAQWVMMRPRHEGLTDTSMQVWKLV